VQIVRSVADLRRALSALRADGATIALVPTMGALHAGHMALVNAAKLRARHVVVSIFVNPRQFGPREDLAAYPRQEAADVALLEAAGAALLWAPAVEAMYPEGFATNVTVAGVSEGLDGAARPGHFDGVATVVLKLFNQARPDVAFFGEKDFQQLAVIRRMVADLDLPVEVIGHPTERADDGLALSSRNAYLSDEQRAAAAAIPAALRTAADSIRGGKMVGAALAAARSRLEQAGFDPIDYVELRDAATLGAVDRLAAPARLFVAAKIGTTRLIDNIAVDPA
jgi:pantoate--beta-alanine ligase